MTQPPPQLNNSDLELLSTYIDQRVTGSERAALEARLEQEPALRQALDELRSTVTLLRELPPVRPPRSFTIDPATVKPRGFGIVAWLRLGSALAAVLLAMTFSVELLQFSAPAAVEQTAGAPANAPERAPAAPAPMVASVPTTAPAAAGSTAREAVAATAVPAATTAPAAPAAPGAAGVEAAPTATEAPAPTAAPAAASGAPAQPAGTIPPGIGMAGAPTLPLAAQAPVTGATDLAPPSDAPAVGGAAAGPTLPGENAPPAAPELAQAGTPQIEPFGTTTPATKAAPATGPAGGVPQPQPPAVTEPPGSSSRAAAVSPLRLAQVSLLVLTVGLAAAALIAGRRARG